MTRMRGFMLMRQVGMASGADVDTDAEFFVAALMVDVHARERRRCDESEVKEIKCRKLAHRFL